MVPGSVEAERLFSDMSFIKNSLRNCLQQPHLSACLRSYNQPWYTVSGANAWPYKEVVARL